MRKLSILVMFHVILFVSTYSQNYWTQPMHAFNIECLAVNGSNVFAGTMDNGLFLSTNNGLNWTPANNGLSNFQINCLEVSGSKIFAGTMDGLFVTNNNGNSWSILHNGLPDNPYVISIESDGNNIFAAVYGYGVFLSTNDGSNWSEVNIGLIDPYVTCLKISGTDIFAGTDGGGGVFLSTNNGASWSAVNNGLSTRKDIQSIDICGANIFAGLDARGVYMSTNNGVSWLAVNNGLPLNTTISSFAVSGDNIFTGTNRNGVYLSTNNGLSWTAVNNGLSDLSILSLAINGDYLYAGTWKGVCLSTNNGSNWIPLNSGLTVIDIRCLSASGKDIFVGTLSGLFHSSNNGMNWVPANNGLTNLNISCLGINGSLIYAGLSNGGVFKSADNGSKWTSINGDLANLNIGSLILCGTNIIVSTISGGVYISTNEGANWTRITSGLPALDYTYKLLSNGNEIYAYYSDKGIFLSTNNGSSWTPVNNWNPSEKHIISLGVNGNSIFACIFNQGLLLSTNKGVSWTAVNNGLTTLHINCFAFIGTSILAGSGGGGIFFSTNNGDNWTQLNSGLTNLRVANIAISGNNIYTGSDNGGVFIHRETTSPILATSEPNSITLVSSLSGGNITDDGGAEVTNRGVVWNIDPEPTIENNLGMTSDGVGMGVFTSLISGLTENTKYHVRAFATNSVGTAYGEDIIFKTLPNPPILVTYPVSSITVNSATSNNEITDIQMDNPFRRGVCWNTTGNPTVTDNTREERGLYDVGTYTGLMFPLEANTIYYVKAFAENIAGIGYGNEIDFTTLPNPPICLPATNITSSAFTANWQAPVQGSAPFTYTLEIATDRAFLNQIAGSPFSDLNVTSLDISGLNSNTSYYFRVKIVNSTGSSSWREGSTKTLVEAPSVQASGIYISSVRSRTAVIRWTKGNGTGSFVLVKSTNSILNSEFPLDGTIYPKSSSSYSFAPSINGAKIIYYGALANCSVNGLSRGTTYFIRVFAYNGLPSDGTAKYNSSDATGNPISFTMPSARIADDGNEAIAGSFTLGNIYPNPAKDEIEFTLDIPEAGQYSVEIFNEAGEQFPTGLSNISYPSGTQSIKIGTQNLSSGSYTLLVKCGNAFAIQRFVVVK